MKLSLAGEPAYAHVLFEHQSESDPWLALRMLSYTCHTFEQARGDRRGRAKLSPVLPIVLYHGRRPWTPTLVFSDLYAIPETAKARFGSRLVDFRIQLEQAGAPKLKEIAVTTAEKLIRQGRTEGRAEGRTEGRAEGILEGGTRAKRELVRQLMHVRFGELSLAVVARLEAAGQSELDLMVERLLAATCAEEVVGE